MKFKEWRDSHFPSGGKYDRLALEAWHISREKFEKGLKDIMNELGVPQSGYPQPVANAYKIAKRLLKGKSK